MLRPHFKLMSLCFLTVFLLAACGSTAPQTAAPATTTAAGATSVPTAQATTRAATAPAGGTATRSGTTTTAGTATRVGTAGSTPAAAAPRPQLPVTVKDKDGRSVTITDVSRTIALTGDVAEIIWALGMSGSVIATDTSVTYPPEAQKAPKIGYMRTLAAEGILAQKPTLLIGGESAGPPEVLEQLRGAGVPVVIIASPTTLEAPGQKIRAVAGALGVPAAGEQLASATQAEIDAAVALAAKATTRPRVMFLNVRGNQVQQISGKGAPAQAIIEAAGGIDAGTAAGVSGYKSITPEALVTGQPDFYLLFKLGLDSVGGVDGLLKIPGVDQTPAGSNRRVL
ncbi:MAG TPA: ABC transporter substrate-binding protein, partial [Thermomicrobiales bacterium]